MAGGKAARLAGQLWSDQCSHSFKWGEENKLNPLAQPHPVLVVDLARDLLAEAVQSKDTARVAYTLQIGFC